MPRLDGTGPRGQGPMTGRGLGFCAGFNRPGAAQAEPRRGFGRGPGFGARFASAPARTPVRVPAQNITEEQKKNLLNQEKQAVEKELEALENELKNIKERMNKMKED